ncbi:MAG TPA: carboxypeptidase-like regulatory domain-containing protein, partial [Bryobacterales bacterium]|nr:carboxypeptidase-like regulatory domain-containing protein [Bryobacterales bacterium]
MRQSLVFTLLLAVLFLSATQLPAQTATGVITGSLTDSTGAVIPGAKVTLTDQQTNQSREQMSNESGIYEFRALPRGNYTLSAELDGFKKEEVTGIQLTVAQTLRLDVQMEVGALTEQVTVEATAGLVQVGD